MPVRGVQDGHEIVRAVTGARIGKRQLEEIWRGRGRRGGVRGGPAGAGRAGPHRARRGGTAGRAGDVRGRQGRAMRRRRCARGRRARPRNGTGKGTSSGAGKQANKRMAETGVVFDSLPPDGEPRTPEEVMLRPAGQPPRTPRPLTAGIPVYLSSCANVIAEVFAESAATRHERHWVALVDGNTHQIECFLTSRGTGHGDAVLIDFIHVIEYLWKAASSSPRPATSAPPKTRSPTGERRSSPGNAGASSPTSPPGPPRTPRDPAGSMRRTSARPSITCRPRNLPGLPRGARERLADLHRHHRGRMPAHHRRPHRSHRRPLEPGRSPGHALDARHRRQLRPARLLGPAHRPEHHRNHLSKLQNPPTPQHALGLAA